MKLVRIFAVLVLVGCSALDGGETDPYRAACESSCDRDSAVCEDAGSARRGGNSQFGGQAACDRQYDRCVKRCKAMTPPKKKPAAGQTPAGQPTEQVVPPSTPIPPSERSDLREQPWRPDSSGPATAPAQSPRRPQTP